MCNLNILIKTNQTEDQERENLNFYMCACTNSFINNSDGEGFYFDKSDLLIKSKQKIDIIAQMDNLKNSKFILGHERISTSGHEDTYIQPFQNDDFVLMHNGILNDYVKNAHSDTFNLFEDFKLLFNNVEGSRQEKIIKCIKSALDDNEGSFSISIFDKKENALYYFKNDKSQIHVVRTKDKKLMFLTTSNSNIGIFDIYKEKSKKIDIQNFKIYKITIREDKVNFHIIGKIKKPSMSKVYYPWGYKYSYNDVYTISTPTPKIKENVKEDLRYLKKRFDIREDEKEHKCLYCDRKTKNLQYKTGYNMCDECIQDPSVQEVTYYSETW